jgi:hypothetical protein
MTRESDAGYRIKSEIGSLAKGYGNGRGRSFARTRFPSDDQRIHFQIERFIHAMMLDADAIGLIDEVEA